MDNSSMRVGVVFWQQDDELASLIASELEIAGCKTFNFLYDAKLPETLDVILAYGPLDSLVPLANQLLACPPPQRPLFALWMTEQFPDPTLPEWMRHTTGVIRSRLEQMAFSQDAQGKWQPDPRLRWLTSKMHRYRYYGDIYWLQQQNILSILAISSPWIAESLRAPGFKPIIADLGCHSDWMADLGLKRDIPVLWLGKAGSKRRKIILNRIRAELDACGVEMLMVDGVEHPYVFGEERTVLLNRTKIALNILREKWDDNSMRYCLAAANRVLIVTEPTLPHTSMVSGIHLVEVPVEQIADNICYYLSHEEERQKIVEQAYHLITTEMTLRKGIAQILEQVVFLQQRTISA